MANSKHDKGGYAFSYFQNGSYNAELGIVRDQARSDYAIGMKNPGSVPAGYKQEYLIFWKRAAEDLAREASEFRTSKQEAA